MKCVVMNIMIIYDEHGEDVEYNYKNMGIPIE
jgi:hypothetical protein